jgi:DNA-binding cell septation regulator SpoVG
MRITAWRPLHKNTMRGFVSIELQVGLVISDAIVHVGTNGPWVAMPGKPQVEPDGTLRRGPNGKPAYVNILSWRSRALADQFSSAVISELIRRHPDALEGGLPMS